MKLSVLFCCVMLMFCSVLLCYAHVLFCSVVLCSCSVLFCSVVLCSCSVLFCSVVLCSCSVLPARTKVTTKERGRPPLLFGPLSVEVALFIDALVSMRSKEVALGLSQICRQARATVRVIVSQRCSKCWNRNTHAYSLLQNGTSMRGWKRKERKKRRKKNGDTALILSRKTARIMHPPFQMRAMEPNSNFHPLARPPSRIKFIPCA